MKKKAPLQALAWELLPGAGSLYADDCRGAAVTWGVLTAGLAASFVGLANAGPVLPDHDSSTAHSAGSPVALPLLLGGLALCIGGRIYGAVNAVQASDRYNSALRVRLGLPPEPPFAR